MGRPPKFTTEQILDATARSVAIDGPHRTTVMGVAASLGAPSGSIYHRFESRDLLLAQTWIRTVLRAQEGFMRALAADDVHVAARNAALHIPRWARQHVDEAKVLLLYRRQDLADTWPDELGEELATLNDQLRDAMRHFTTRYFGRLSKSGVERTRFALVDIPYAAVRRHLSAGEAPPRAVDELVATASRAVLERR